MIAITTSVFELFKIGPGPSSSHTIGPMKAGFNFNKSTANLKLETAPDSIEVRLYGSLSATGEGHGTDRAVVAGLLGYRPDTVECEFLDSLADRSSHQFESGDISLPLSVNNVVFAEVENNFPYSNTMLIRLKKNDQILFEQEYYSIGGGFIKWKGQIPKVPNVPAHPYSNTQELKNILTTTKKFLHRLVLENETAITGASEDEINIKLDAILDTMKKAVKNGIKTDGLLPGPIGLHRKARSIYLKTDENFNAADKFLIRLNAYAFAASEENAAGHIVVTAPTSGSAGVIPAVIYTLEEDLGISRKMVRQGMLAAAAIGFIAKHNASIAGAEVGCQGEVGVASAMAAALITYANGFRFWQTENAAESALEHHLGMTCDPVGGYVQIPCIERNAMGAVRAYNSYIIATVENRKFHKVTFDEVVEAMAQTGKDMSNKYKETSKAGLAVSVPDC
ncbi:L-serine ammonia-lyase [Maridesulfovibrio hydrothermalis]|uniref:L-serine dehydratase n=1 Tax=Maridesulfovibrio hydrothermalis AM13 = DSM 14728 TaxID=1121451 RepID=L0R874_9BACT|nr:L-serine ammonia-lyase [Maridesulfovibrio hydrothermalis]CCO22412.1 L-serine dehydratase [Maridesulfovibrio hydrothermalis AM13 = DSM 14728]